MANTTAAKKAYRSSERKKLVNNSNKSRIRTFIRKVDDAIKAGEETKAQEAFKNLEPEMMKGVKKNLFHINTAARKLSRLYSAIKKIKKA
jgi:small subunit ribosomal protein S20